MTRYRIYELSARAVMSFAREEDGRFTFNLNKRAVGRSRVPGAHHEQDANALFFQTMCVLRGEDHSEPRDDVAIPDLAGVIFYMNFDGIFNQGGASKRLLRERKAEAMFTPEGITLDFGSGPQRFLPFERSASMSRQSRISFIRADIHDAVRRRIMLDMTVSVCQLSKLYAYNGLMLSGGVRIDGVDIDRPGRVIVIDNKERIITGVPVITVADAGGDGNVHRFRREEATREIAVTCFDGEGLISKQYAAVIDRAYCGAAIHTSFQIRMPYVKGMLHQVDFKDFLRMAGTEFLTDLWGAKHRVEDVDIILTRSMFKGYGWLTDNGMGWEDYWAAFRKYRHALYIVNANKEQPERTTELNYQFLSTVSITAEEFRPSDLPDGWSHSPAEDTRRWLTKETELAYYNFCADRQARLDYFLRHLQRPRAFRKSRPSLMAEVLKRNPLFIEEPVFTKELEKRAGAVLKRYALGRLLVEGDNRYLSGDLLDFLVLLIDHSAKRTRRQDVFYGVATTNEFPEDAMFAPGAVYTHGGACTLLRNPHIARNEELQLSVYQHKNQMRKNYFGHLTDVVMVNAFMLAAERLGGADYDGDMVKTIADPLLNQCVRRNYSADSRDNAANLPLLLIPDAQPRLRDANDWRDRFETVRDTFSARVGQICNAALNRSVVAYSENAGAEERERCREETETLAILTGLEIDAAKTGVSPDLSEYLNVRTVQRSPFLRYKGLVEAAEKRRAWYEPTHAERLKKFFRETDWETVDSNIERLPLLARRLKENTPRIKPSPAPDEALFIYAQEDGWREALDADTLAAVSTLLKDYEACLHRIRACRSLAEDKPRRKDIERTLFARGQEALFDTDELYARFRLVEPDHIATVRKAIRERQWHLMDREKRAGFLLEYLPELSDLYGLLADFRNGGFRVLGDLVTDIDEENKALERKQYLRDKDSPAFKSMMTTYLESPFSEDYKEAVSAQCRALLDGIVKPRVAVRYVVALGKRNLLWDLLLDHIKENTLKREVPPCVE